MRTHGAPSPRRPNGERQRSLVISLAPPPPRDRQRKPQEQPGAEQPEDRPAFENQIVGLAGRAALGKRQVGLRHEMDVRDRLWSPQQLGCLRRVPFADPQLDPADRGGAPDAAQMLVRHHRIDPLHLQAGAGELGLPGSRVRPYGDHRLELVVIRHLCACEKLNPEKDYLPASRRASPEREL